MIECETLEEARLLEKVIHIVAGNPVIAYQVGDELPPYCTIPPEEPEPSEMERMQEQLDVLRGQVVALEAKAVK